MRARRPSGAWSVVALASAAFVALPTLAVLAHVGSDSGGTWTHLAETVLAGYVRNTLALLLGVGAGATAIGVGAAWLVCMYDFPGRRVLTWALLLPMAMPTYLMAYTCTDLLQFSGPVQGWLRESFGWQRGDYWFPQVRSLGGAIVVLALVLYPYVYLLARTAFLGQSHCLLEASRTLGCGPWRAFASLALPLARPAIAAGAALVAMETLAEYGAVDHFAVDTFTTGIYRTWTALASPAAASQLAAALVVFVFVLLALERLARRGARYAPATTRTRAPQALRLAGARAALAAAACGLPVLAGFVLPVGVLLGLARSASHTLEAAELRSLVGNTLLLALAAAFCVVALGLLIAYAARLERSPLVRAAARVVTLGYAVPGSVVAVGVLVALGALAGPLGLFAGSSVFALLYAYSVRFSGVSLQTLEAGLERIRPTLDDAARTLGARPGALLARIHAPLLRGSLFTAALLVFVETMKELPATLILRPFDFDTLAVRVHGYASDERLAQSALPALLIVAVGLVPVILLSRAIERAPGGARSAP